MALEANGVCLFWKKVRIWSEPEWGTNWEPHVLCSDLLLRRQKKGILKLLWHCQLQLPIMALHCPSYLLWLVSLIGRCCESDKVGCWPMKVYAIAGQLTCQMPWEFCPVMKNILLRGEFNTQPSSGCFPCWLSKPVPLGLWILLVEFGQMWISYLFIFHCHSSMEFRVVHTGPSFLFILANNPVR